MDFLWRHGEASVRAVHAQFSETVAYTTLMTTLDRLYKKGLLTRWKIGRAFHYAPSASREECDRQLTADVVEGLLDHHRTTPLPLLSNLVEAVGDQDRRLLDELERLVQEKRERMRNGGTSS